MSYLEPIQELDLLNTDNKAFAFQAKTRQEAQAWQQQCRQAVAEAVGFLDVPPVPANPRVVEEIDRGDFVSRKVIITTAERVEMPVYLLIPQGKPPPLPVVIAYAGHGYGVADIVGKWENGDIRNTPDGYHADFAVALCRQGFLVAAPEISCFGERQVDHSYLQPDQPRPTTCQQIANYAFMLGKSAVGLRVRDGFRLIDYLETLPEADTTRLGAMGISGGGMLTFFHTGLDERIRACVISGYFSTFRESILAMHHCSCNYVPGLLNIGEMDDLIGLILPRPFLAEAGQRDPIFPISAVRRSIARAREISAIFGGDPEKDVILDEFEGRHRINGLKAYPFLASRLGL